MVVLSSETTGAPLTILLFGPMQVLVQDHPLPHLRSRKALWLLALLALRHDRPVEREWLAGILWPDADPINAATNLRANLSELRHAMGNEAARLQSPGRHTLSLNMAGAHADIVTFDAAILNRKPDALKQAVALYRGPLLEDCSEEWVGQERNVREQDCLLALQTLADTALAAGNHGAAIDFYRRAVSLDPWREAAWRGWMEALAKSGDRNAALQVYREFTELLRSDPRAVPDEETSALYARLRTEARSRASSTAAVIAPPSVVSTAAVPPVVGNLPHPITDLIGREEERIEVAARLRASRLVTLTGPGGIGKTRLAIEVARETAEDGAAYTDGVWLIALESLSEGRLVVPQIALALGLQEEPGRSLLESLTAHLRSKRALLVLDNCEHLLEASAQVAGHLLRECARVRILATSREALGIMGETVWQVHSLSMPDPKHLPAETVPLLQTLKSYESVQLFTERAQAVQKTFALTEYNALAVAQVCFQLEGIPLALELAAARVKAMTVEQIAVHLNDRLDLFTGGNRAAQLRQQTLRTTLDWSYALLSDAERLLLERLSVFAGGWTLEAAEAIAKDEEGIRDKGKGLSASVLNPFDVLMSLVDKSLVVFEEQERKGGGRYRLLEMVRRYAAEKLQARGDEERVRARHRDWFLLLAEESAPHLKSGDQRYWLQRLDREHDNLRVALEWSATNRQQAEAELRMVSALWRFWYVRGDYSEGRQYLRNALDREDAQTRTMARAQALNGAGALAYDQGDNAVARAFFEESLNIGRQWKDVTGIASAMGNLANVALAVGESDAARALYEESLALKRNLDDRPGVALALSNLGIVLRQQGDYAAAKDRFEESLSIARSLDDRIGMARAFLNMGNVAWNQGDTVLERTCIEESLKLFRQLGDKQGIARSLGNLGTALNNTDEWEAARTCVAESLHIFQEIGDRRGIAQAFGNLGDIARNQSDYAAARGFYKDRLDLCQMLEDKSGTAESLEALAGILLAQSQSRHAAQLWGAAEKLRNLLGFPLPDNKRKEHDLQLGVARSALGEAVFAVAWEEGSGLSWEQLAAFTLIEEPGNS